MISKYVIFGIASVIRRYTPAVPPNEYSPKERMAYYAGWHECAKNFEDSVVELVEREADK